MKRARRRVYATGIAIGDDNLPPDVICGRSPAGTLAAGPIRHHLSRNPTSRRRDRVDEPARINGGLVFDEIKAIAQRQDTPVAERRMQAEQRFREFKKDWEQAITAPGSQLGRGTNQVDHLRDLLEQGDPQPPSGRRGDLRFSTHTPRAEG
jgi:hypothetical protein